MGLVPRNLSSNHPRKTPTPRDTPISSPRELNDQYCCSSPSDFFFLDDCFSAPSTRLLELFEYTPLNSQCFFYISLGVGIGNEARFKL